MAKVTEHIRKLTLIERLVALGILALSGAAAAIAIDFAVRLKPHVAIHLVLAYALLWGLLVGYVRMHHDGRRIACLSVWLTTIAFCAFVCFIHLDDVPDRLVYRSSDLARWGLSEPGMTWRGSAEQLSLSVALNAAWLVLFSVHALWLGWRRRPDALGPEPDDWATDETEVV